MTHMTHMTHVTLKVLLINHPAAAHAAAPTAPSAAAAAATAAVVKPLACAPGLHLWRILRVGSARTRWARPTRLRCMPRRLRRCCSILCRSCCR